MSTIHLDHVDLSDRRHPEHGGRYVRLTDLFVLAKELRLSDDPVRSLEEVLAQIASMR